jgi:hypothetical protein
MKRIVLIALALLACMPPAQAQRLWLVVGASDLSAAAIAAKSKDFLKSFPGSLIVQTADCGDEKRVFAWVAQAAPSQDIAHATLARVKETINDAYIKRCDVVAGSLLALRVSAIDASIANVPKDAVNWDEENRISEARPLPGGRSVVIVRHFVADKDDPLEGRRERVLLGEAHSGRLAPMEDNCIRPESVVAHDGRIAFQCVREQAGNTLLHSVLAFDASGKKLAEIQRCRTPQWSGVQTVVCQQEAVGPDGRLQLKTKRTELPAAR